MTEEELKGKLTEILLGARNNAILDESEVSVDDMCVIGVRMVFELFKQAKWVQLDPDQSLPKYEDYYPTTTFTPRYQQARIAAWSKGQLRMLNDKFRRVL